VGSLNTVVRTRPPTLVFKVRDPAQADRNKGLYIDAASPTRPDDGTQAESRRPLRLVDHNLGFREGPKSGGSGGTFFLVFDVERNRRPPAPRSQRQRNRFRRRVDRRPAPQSESNSLTSSSAGERDVHPLTDRHPEGAGIGCSSARRSRSGHHPREPRPAEGSNSAISQAQKTSQPRTSVRARVNTGP